MLTETYSPAPMLIAPAASPATPAITIADRSLVAPTAPITMPAVETMPSLAPRTAARSQFSRLLSPPWCGSSSCGPIGSRPSSLAVMGQIQALRRRCPQPRQGCARGRSRPRVPAVTQASATASENHGKIAASPQAVAAQPARMVGTIIAL